MLDRGVSITLDLYIFIVYENKIIKTQLRVVSFTKIYIIYIYMYMSDADTIGIIVQCLLLQLVSNSAISKLTFYRIPKNYANAVLFNTGHSAS